jgi:3-oxoacyl-[acyl-carrier-protein] synthase-3
MRAKLHHLRLAALSVATGPVTRTLDDEAHLYADQPGQLDRMRAMVGIERRHIAPVGITTLDLARAATERVLRETGTTPDDLDAILFVTQTPDHPQPCNANLLHGQLACPPTTAALDINQGCSGWVYGLYFAGLLLETGAARTVLLCAGDTITQTIHPRDRATVPLFGDAASAALLTRPESPSPAWFDLHSDGRGHGAICIPAGGARRPRDAHTSLAEVAEDGSERSPENLFMSGIEVFNFTLREEPKAVRELLEYAGMETEAVDIFAFHQANPFILTQLARRLRLPLEKVPMRTAREFGNQSSASIPGVLAHDCGEQLATRRTRLLCSGFGVGLSWASCLLDVEPLDHVSIFQFQPPAPL